MRIAYFVDCFPVTSETFVINEIVALEKMGAAVEVFSINQPTKIAPHAHAAALSSRTNYYSARMDQSVNKAREHFIHAAKHPFRYLRAFQWAKSNDEDLFWNFKRMGSFARFLKTLAITHIHAQFANTAAECAMVVSEMTGIPFSVTTHHYDILLKPYRYYPMLGLRAKFIRTISEYNRKALIKLGVPADKIEVIHCGVNVDDVKPLPVEKNFDLVCVARLEKVKGLHCLIEAVDLLAKRWPTLRVAVIGEGSERSALEVSLAEKGLNDLVRLMGALSQEKVFACLNQAKIAVLPSLSEGIPVSLMEAMAAELPVVSTCITGIPELVHDGVTGFLVNPGDASQLANRLERLLVNEQIRHEFGRKGRAKITAEFNLFQESTKLLTLMTKQN
jgi:glycosyltransferase involved in cell wall biosynthesis